MRALKTAAMACVVLSGTCVADDALELALLETHDLQLLYFDPAQTYLAPYAARSFQNSVNFQKSLYGWTPWEKTTVLLTDFSDYGNAGALASPINMLSIDVGPISQIFETFSVNERIFTLMNHEMTHVANLDAWNTQDAKWRRFFSGKPRPTNKHPETILYNYLTVPRMSTPRWYTEGAAVFMETWMSGGIGRAQGAYDEMVFRAMVRDGAHFYSNLGLVSEGTAVDFQVGVNAYLYGGRFYSYLGYAYSPEQIVEWLSRGENSKRYYASQFEHVFGKPLEDAWDDWIAFEKDFQAENLDAIRRYPVTRAQPLAGQAMGSVSRAFLSRGGDHLLGAFRYPGVVAHVGELRLEDGEKRVLADLKDPMLYSVSSTAYDAESNTLFYTNDNHAFRDVMAVNIGSGKVSTLLKDARIGDLAFDRSDRSLWGLRHLNGYVTLVNIPYPWEEWTQVHTWPYGTVPFDLDVAPDGSLISLSMGEISGDQFLRVFRTEDLSTERAQPMAQFDFGTAIPEGFVFSPDGKYLYGSSYYTGVSNIFRYEIATGDIEAVSNAETGYFRPIPMDDGRLIAFEYTGEGFLPVIFNPEPLDDLHNIRFLGSEIANKHPVVREWAVGSPAEISLEEVLVDERTYRLTREMGFKYGYPVLEGYRDEWALGWNWDFADATQLHNFAITGSYSPTSSLPSSERLHVNVEYQSLNWRARYWHNDADFYDLFGPTKRSRKGDAFIVGYDRTLIWDQPRRLRVSADLSYYTGLDTLPNNQNRPTFFIEDILSLRANLDYTDTRRSLGAVDHEKGWQWLVEGKVDHSEFDTIPKLRAQLDFGFALPWKHSSIWFYTGAGWADGDRLDPLTNYYFGGFGNNYVDDKDVKRYRNYYSMPGFEIDEIGGREFAKVTAEWNLPPIRFRNLGKPGLYLKHIRPAVFASGLHTDPGNAFERTTYSVGVQLDLEFTLIHRLPMTLSVGYAAGYEDGEKNDDEWMISLKIL